MYPPVAMRRQPPLGKGAKGLRVSIYIPITYNLSYLIFVSFVNRYTLDKYPIGVYNMREVICMENCCCMKTKKRSEKEYKSLINRLSRIEGQIRGIRSMVENDAYCVDILTQSSAVGAAIDAFNRELLSEHIKTCVTDDIRAGKEEKTDELMDILRKLMR